MAFAFDLLIRPDLVETFLCWRSWKGHTIVEVMLIMYALSSIFLPCTVQVNCLLDKREELVKEYRCAPRKGNLVEVWRARIPPSDTAVDVECPHLECLVLLIVGLVVENSQIN